MLTSVVQLVGHVPLAEAILATIVVTAVLAVLRGDLVPKKIFDAELRHRDQEIERLTEEVTSWREVSQMAAHTAMSLLEVGRTTEDVLKSIGETGEQGS